MLEQKNEVIHKANKLESLGYSDYIKDEMNII